MSFWKVRLEQVKAITPIPDADAIELATIAGWKCVVKKGEFKVDDWGIYFPIDSLLPSDNPHFAFMKPRGYRVKTIKLRGQISQGLLMPMSILNHNEAVVATSLAPYGTDLSEMLGVQKYEPPMPTSGKQKGPFPGFLRKTDEERIQNIPDIIEGRTAGEFEITEKLDGTSCTVYCHTMRGLFVDENTPMEDATVQNHTYVGVCSRNWEMKQDDDNVYAEMVRKYDLEAKLRAHGRNIAIQGEIIGRALQGNKYKLSGQELYVFNVYDIDSGEYLSPFDRNALVSALGLKHVPVVSIKDDFPLTLDAVLDFADGNSEIGSKPKREGLVFKDKTRGPTGELVSFKVISNKWLLKYDE